MILSKIAKKKKKKWCCLFFLMKLIWNESQKNFKNIDVKKNYGVFGLIFLIKKRQTLIKNHHTSIFASQVSIFVPLRSLVGSGVAEWTENPWLAKMPQQLFLRNNVTDIRDVVQQRHSFTFYVQFQIQLRIMFLTLCIEGEINIQNVCLSFTNHQRFLFSFLFFSFFNQYTTCSGYVNDIDCDIV
jgi:hypothetical protein